MTIFLQIEGCILSNELSLPPTLSSFIHSTLKSVHRWPAWVVHTQKQEWGWTPEASVCLWPSDNLDRCPHERVTGSETCPYQSHSPLSTGFLERMLFLQSSVMFQHGEFEV